MAYAEENFLIRYCSRVYPDQDIVNAIDSQLNLSLDWAYIIEEAQDQDIAPLIYYHLSRFKEKISSHVLSELKKIFEKVRDTNSRLYEELKKIIRCLKENNIDAMLLKGMDLAARIYPDIALRPMTDIDLLIKKEDLAKCEKPLSSLNYLVHPGFRKILDTPPSPYLNAVVCKKLTSPFVSLHLHWHILNYTFSPGYGYISNLDIDSIWQEAELTKIDNVEVLRMAPHHLLLHLSEHHLKHYFDRLILLTDIDSLLNYYRGTFNWERTLRNAFEFNFSRVLFYTLYIVSHILGTVVPKDILFRLKPNRTSRFENKFIDSILTRKPSRNLSFFMFLGMNKGAARKIRFISRTILPHPRYIFQLQDVYGIKSSFKYTLNHLRRIFTYTLNLFKKAKD